MISQMDKPKKPSVVQKNEEKKQNKQNKTSSISNSTQERATKVRGKKSPDNAKSKRGTSLKKQPEGKNNEEYKNLLDDNYTKLEESKPSDIIEKVKTIKPK